MILERGIAKAFAMNDATWRRHANPWSVWTRVATLPLWVLAVWSRVWLGVWALGPVIVLAFWTWVNPRLFPVPDATNNWASKGVMGERIWLNRDRVPIPRHHWLVPHLLLALTLLGSVLLIWGLVELAPWPTMLGMALVFLGKLWFVDRMAWLYEDMKNATPEYRSWAVSNACVDVPNTDSGRP